ncbi:hypothetical protein BX600DRAFT_482245 [Xylariales sp. PMI_506]|nr:hypothetical protein BX600DRAFT_482245 [Xylariales sp. PMI_506]
MSPKWTPELLPSLKAKTFLVTGGNTGIGKATVAGLARQGAKVYMGARSKDKALAAIEDIRNEISTAEIFFLEINLSSFESVVAAANKVKAQETHLHGLINNAGIMGVPFQLTDDQFDIQWQTNYLSHWLLTHHLLPLLISTAAGSSSPREGSVRIINVTSNGHDLFPPKEGIRFDDINLSGASGMMRYGQSKLANVLHAKELHARYGPQEDSEQKPEVWTAAVHPGTIDTDLNRQATGIAPASVLKLVVPVMACLGILDRPEKGGWSSLYAVASHEFTRGDSGAYVVPYAKIGVPSTHARDGELTARLWKYTEEEFGRRGLLLDAASTR